jgi:hypothetical protein
LGEKIGAIGIFVWTGILGIRALMDLVFLLAEKIGMIGIYCLDLDFGD